MESAEISLQQSLKACAVSRLVLRHFVDGVVNSVEVSSLCSLCKVKLAFAGACLSVSAHLEVLFGAVGQNLAEQLGNPLCRQL